MLKTVDLQFILFFFVKYLSLWSQTYYLIIIKDLSLGIIKDLQYHLSLQSKTNHYDEKRIIQDVSLIIVTNEYPHTSIVLPMVRFQHVGPEVLPSLPLGSRWDLAGVAQGGEPGWMGKGRQNTLKSTIISGVMKLSISGGSKNTATVRWFWGISLIIVHCSGEVVVSFSFIFKLFFRIWGRWTQFWQICSMFMLKPRASSVAKPQPKPPIAIVFTATNVDGSDIQLTSWYVVYPIICKVCISQVVAVARFLPSTVDCGFKHVIGFVTRGFILVGMLDSSGVARPPTGSAFACSMYGFSWRAK